MYYESNEGKVLEMRESASADGHEQVHGSVSIVDSCDSVMCDTFCDQREILSRACGTRK